jgi:hypothetical protein
VPCIAGPITRRSSLCVATSWLFTCTLASRIAHWFVTQAQELNESVTGNYVEEDPVALLNAKPDFFRIFTLVIATQVGSISWSLTVGTGDGCLRDAALHVTPLSIRSALLLLLK